MLLHSYSTFSDDEIEGNRVTHVDVGENGKTIKGHLSTRGGIRVIHAERIHITANCF